MIEVKNLTKKYGDHKAVNDLSFTIENGRIYGLLGPNGAGKSTTMNIITGCLSATSGHVSINGHDIFDEPTEAKKCIGYLPELPPVYPDMTPYEYLTFVAEAKGVDRNDIYGEVVRVMEATQITEKQDRLIKNLSKGFRQRVGIAQAMVGAPEIIILDEPTVGLDPKQIIEIRDLIKSLGKDHTVILSSHILSEISAVCDYVMIIAHGSLVASDTIDNLGKYLAGSTVTTLLARGDKNRIMSSLESITEIEIKSSVPVENEGEDVFEYVLETEKNVDIREKVFRKIADIGCTILNMDTKKIGLEEVFLKLTEDENREYNEKLRADEKKLGKHFGRKNIKEDIEESFDNVPEKPKAEKKSDGDDDYKPLFGLSDDSDKENK